MCLNGKDFLPIFHFTVNRVQSIFLHTLKLEYLDFFERYSSTEISAWNNGSLVPSAAHTTLIETERKPSFFQELLPSTEPLSTVSFSMLSTTTDRLDKLSSA